MSTFEFLLITLVAIYVLTSIVSQVSSYIMNKKQTDTIVNVNLLTTRCAELQSELHSLAERYQDACGVISKKDAELKMMDSLLNSLRNESRITDKLDDAQKPKKPKKPMNRRVRQKKDENKVHDTNDEK